MLLRTTLHGLWARKRRLIATATAVVLGVAFLSATLVLGTTLDASFGAVFRQANAGTDVVVRGTGAIHSDQGTQRPDLDADLTQRIASVDGVANVVAKVTGTAQILDAGGDPVGGQGPPTDASNWVADAALNPYRVLSGHAPEHDGEVVIDTKAAADGHLAVGDTATILVPEPVAVRVVGLVGFGDGDATSTGGATYVGLTDRQATELLGTSGKVSELLVRGDGHTSDAELRDEVAKVIPSDAEAITGAQLTAEQERELQGEFLGFLKAFLLAFAGVALVVATFSIANTFAILSAQRSRESALLRAIGAERRQILTMAALEATILGAAASAVGLATGLGLALGLRSLLSALGLDLPAGGLAVRPSSLIGAFAAGLAATLVAACVPAIRSSRIAPIEALRDSAAEAVSWSRWRAAIGAVVGAAGVVVLATATRSPDGAMARAGVGALLAFVATVVLGPVLARPAAALVGAPAAASRGVVGRLARRNAMRNPRRTSGAALALVIGAAVVAVFASFGASLSRSINATVSKSFGGDLVVMPQGFAGAGLSPELATRLAALPEVSDAVGLRDVTATIDGATALPTAADPAAMARVLDLDVTQGDIGRLSSGQIAISRAYADDHHLAMGDRITMRFPDDTTKAFQVRAIYGVADLIGDLVIDQVDWAPHAKVGDVAVLVGLSDGTSLADGRRAVEAVAKGYGHPSVEDREQYVDRMAGQIDQLLTVVYGLLLLAVVIALIGLANTLSLSIHERSRELGLLRAIGLDRAKVRAMVRWESVITAIVGTAVGLGLGLVVAWGMIRALATQEGFITFGVPTSTLVVVLVASIGAGIVASLRPSHRAAKLDVLDAIAER